MSLPSATVLLDVSLSLTRLISTFIKELRGKDKVIFKSPGEIPDDNHTKLVVFLYRLATDPWTKNQLATYKEGPDGKFIEIPPPQALNLNYVMVPYAQETETELVIADKLRRLFYNHPALQGPWLGDRLKASGNHKINIVPADPPMEKIYNLWAGFSGKPYKLSLFYNLVPTFIPGEPKNAFAPVGVAQLGSGEDVPEVEAARTGAGEGTP